MLIIFLKRFNCAGREFFTTSEQCLLSLSSLLIEVFFMAVEKEAEEDEKKEKKEWRG